MHANFIYNEIESISFIRHICGVPLLQLFASYSDHCKPKQNRFLFVILRIYVCMCSSISCVLLLNKVSNNAIIAWLPKWCTIFFYLLSLCALDHSSNKPLVDLLLWNKFFRREILLWWWRRRRFRLNERYKHLHCQADKLRHTCVNETISARCCVMENGHHFIFLFAFPCDQISFNRRQISCSNKWATPLFDWLIPKHKMQCVSIEIFQWRMTKWVWCAQHTVLLSTKSDSRKMSIVL